MNAVELFLLGRTLARLGEDAFPAGGYQRLPASVRAVLIDALGHPGTTIGAVVARTGLPQSQVSAAVARFRDQGVLITEPDPADRRRTLVRPAPGLLRRGVQRAAVPVDDVIARALKSDDPREVAEVLAALDLLASRLIPRARSRLAMEEIPDDA